MIASTLSDYQLLIQIDMIINGVASKYPYQLNEQAKYTHHQITLYQSDYCHLDSAPVKEQPTVVGGVVDVVLI
jgi:hypothetical protein